MSTDPREHAPTEKLYWQDAFVSAFDRTEAPVALSTYEGKPSLVLAATHFYPEGGGQLGDSGTLSVGDLHVVVADTQVDARGVIHHVLAEALSPEAADALTRAIRGSESTTALRGVVDEARRRDHMVQHTAQHALSRALADAARAGTVSARLGATTCTIDIDKPGIGDADLHRAEDLVNAVIMSDVAVTASFPSADELAALDLRKKPNAEKAKDGVRVVAIEGFDLTPCGGTHCSRTGQIGQVRIVATEKYKGMTRITFHAGRRALTASREGSAILASLAADLTCGAADVPAAVTKLRAETKALRERLEATRAELAGHLARALVETLTEASLAASGRAGAPFHVVPVLRAKDDLSSLRILANELTSDPRQTKIVALVAGEDAATGDLAIVVQRGPDARSFDCGAFVSARAKAAGGRGGGRPERAEGRFPRGTSLVAGLEALATAARQNP